MYVLKILSVATVVTVTSFSLSPLASATDTVPSGTARGTVQCTGASGAAAGLGCVLGKEEAVENSIGIELILIVPGEFLLSSIANETGCYDDEQQHSVKLAQPFFVGVHEVTQEQWQGVMGTNPSRFTATGRDTSRFPVERVTWYDCIEFCNALSRREDLPEYYGMSNITREAGRITGANVTIEGGNGYRLPTEAEWEYACQGRTTSNALNMNDNFSHGTPESGPYLGRTTAVGSNSPNGFGLYDMHGNVWEWCWDEYDAVGYAERSGTTIDPAVNSPSDRRVIRGGSWSSVSEAHACRVSRLEYAGWPDFYIGFRVARTP